MTTPTTRTEEHTVTALPASYITRVLRREGHTILPAGTPRSREGVRVSQSHNAATVTVAADFDAEAMGERRVAQIHETLEGLGFEVTVNPTAASILTVTRKAETPEEHTVTEPTASNAPESAKAFWAHTLPEGAPFAPHPTRDDDYTPEAVDRDAEEDPNVGRGNPRTLRVRVAQTVGWAHTDAVLALIREVAAQELRAIALDVDNDTVSAILNDRADTLTL